MAAETSMDSRLMFNTVSTATAVIAGRSRPKDGVASLAYDPAIQLLTK